MTVTDAIVQKIIRKLLHGDDYRIEVITLLNAEFLDYAISFFKQVVDARLENQAVTVDWYKKELLNPNNPNLSPNDIAINSGLNHKTIVNMYNSATRTIVLDASSKHYELLYQAISSLVENDHEIDITLTIKFRGVSVDLNINESLIVINTLAVKRDALRSGLWSTAGKRVEKPLMTTLCQLFNVPAEHYNLKNIPKSKRQIDFYLRGETPQQQYKCEVKLMGRGNPESADGGIAKGAHILVADKLSDLNKRELTGLGIEWVELRAVDGYKRFLTVLHKLKIPGQDFTESLDSRLDRIFKSL